MSFNLLPCAYVTFRFREKNKVYFLKLYLLWFKSVPALFSYLPELRKNGVMVSGGCPSVQPGLLCFGWRKDLLTLKTGGKEGMWGGQMRRRGQIYGDR